MKNKGMALNGYIIALLVFSLVIIGFTIIPSQEFWIKYEYSMPSNNMSNLDKSSSVSSTIQDLVCDINPESESCPTNKKNVFEQVTNFVEGMVQGGYGALITIYKSFGLAKVLIESVSEIIGVPPQVTVILTSIMLFSIVFTIILIIFNRSDAG